jgi:type II secretory ATPase GspE/PulE/Tfp pilus assembly ATPase PilB-like protein
VEGEKITIDLKKEKFELLDIGRLGFGRRSLLAVKEVLKKRKGLVAVVGNFNSGRTTTLYSFLNRLNRPDLNLAGS